MSAKSWRYVVVLNALAVLATLPGSWCRAQPITPDDPGAANVRFTVNSATGAKPISPYIYGVNFYQGSGFTNPVTLDRQGGNRWSAYNWETNASNAGKDYKYQNDYYLTNNVANLAPGAALTPSLQGAAAGNRALVVTVPMAGYVSGDAAGPVAKADFAQLTRFKQVVAKKDSIYPGSPLSTSPNKTDNYVFTDEFVNWVETTKTPGQKVFYSLDNEPALWGETLPANFDVNNWDDHLGSQPGRTHPEVHPYAPTFAEMKQKTLATAGAIKDVNPNAVVFGGVGYGYAEFTGLQGASDATTSPSHPGGNQAGELNYVEWLLNESRIAEQAQGRKLMDVLDVHWYPEATGGGTRIAFDNSTTPSAALVTARVQAPRSLWDATYTETSWITGCCSGGPIKLLKHLQRDVQDFNPGTKLSVTEYNYGGGKHISGGVAEADALGIFGREGLYAASLWPIAGSGQEPFTAGAFKMYLNYDGQGGKFGDTSIDAATDVIADSAVYASVDSSNPNQMVLVAINRSSASKTSGVAVTADRRFDVAEVYQLTSASSSPVRIADVPINLVNAFQFTMPSLSVSTLVLRTFASGDFNGDGVVDGADLGSLQGNFGLALGATYRQGDNDRDGDVDGADLLGWQQAVGAAAAVSSAATIPEPPAIDLLLIALASGAARSRRRRDC